jgi:protein-tyrosine phosphatase
VSDTLRVLAVCTGNLCRSPYAEVALRRALPDLFEVTSAGTQARDGDQAPAPAVLLGETKHLDLRSHRARFLTADLVAGADLVLALGTEHRRAAVQHTPAAVRRSFTLLEFARLGDSLGADELEAAASGSTARERLAGILRLVASQRGAVSSSGVLSDDVVDPYGHSADVYALMANQIDEALPGVVRALSFAA